MATEELRDRIRKDHLIFRPQPELGNDDITFLTQIFEDVAELGGQFADVKSLQKVLTPLDLKLDDPILKKYAHYNRSGLLQMTLGSFIDAVKYKLHSKKFFEEDCKYGFRLLDAESKGYLEEDEIGRLCSARSRQEEGHLVSEELVHEMLQEGDKDEDGKINWNDFLFHMRSTNILSKTN